LALELAAARAAVFSPRALEARLAEGLPLPAGPRDLPARQRTLRATIDWSYRLLNASEQTLLAALSPFVGGVRLDAAERLWGLDGVEGLISLAEKSLLRRREDADGEPRFWMLELVRQYATEVAEADGLIAEAMDRHGRCYHALTEEARPRLIGRDQRKWLDRLERDHANLRAALEHFTEQGSDRALRMASTLSWFWDMRGYQLEARRRLDEALQRVPPGSPNRGDALRCAGWMAGRQGDPETAQTLQRAALPLLLASGDQRLIAQIYSRLAVVAEMLHDDDEANAWHEQAIATARAAGDPWALGIALNNYAITRTVRSDPQRAMSLLEEALAVLRPTGDAYTISMAVANVAEYALNSGDPYGAQALVEEALELGRQIDFRPLVAGMLEFGAVIALEQGDVATAAARFREALDVGIPFQGESIAVRLSLAAAMAAIEHRPLRAALLWGAAEHVYDMNGIDDRPIHRRLRARWESQALADAADQAAWDGAWKAGAEISMDDALAVAAGWKDAAQAADPASTVTAAR
jgi:tetratricopeptide (TPR) repeat protein